MNVVIFGATGQTGRLLTGRAVADGHTVTGFVRDPARLNLTRDSVRIVQGDVLDAAAVDRGVAGQQAVLVALGTATSRRSPTVLPQGSRHILGTMEKHGVRRVVVLTAAGALHEPADVVRVKAVRVLLRQDRVQNELAVDLLRQRQLHEDAVDLRVAVDLVDQGQELGLARRGRQLTSDEFVRRMPAIAN